MVDWGKVATGAATALVVGLGAVFVSGASDGRIVGWMGGVSNSDFEDTQSTIVELQADLDLLKNQSSTITIRDSLGEVPSGAVVAFDLPSRCPGGWSPFAAGQNVFIVGASFGLPNELFRDDSFSDKKYRAHGGEEEVVLKVREMPSHAHAQTWGQGAGTLPGQHVGNSYTGTYKGQKIQSTLTEGQGASHNNMPPYIALYFCKKD